MGRALRGTPCECSAPYKASGCLIWRNRGIGALDLPRYFCACQNRAISANGDGDPVTSSSVSPCIAEVYIRPAAQVQDMSHLGMLSGSVRYSTRNRTTVCTATLPEGDFRAVTNPDGAEWSVLESNMSARAESASDNEV